MSTRNGRAANETLAVARQLLAAGVSFLPVMLDGSKRPDWRLLPREKLNEDTGKFEPTWGPYQERLPTEAEAHRWFGGERPAALGSVGGRVSGNLEQLDFDAHADETFPAWCAMVEEERPGLAARLCVARTPREPAGYHVRYRCPDATIPGNTTLAAEEYADPETGKPKKRTLIETRGEGGYAVAPGSPAEVHETGRPYRHHGGPPLTDLPRLTAADREVLIRCARYFDRTPPAEEQAREAKGKGEGLRPGDDFDARGPDWKDILRPHGWSLACAKGRELRWKRPGKDAPGWSATTGHCTSKGADLLRVFSSSAQPFEDGKAYGKFRAYALLNHRGDFAAAARDLAGQGYGAQRGGGGGKAAASPGPKGPASSGGLMTTSLDTIRAEPITWLVPDYIPLGKLVLWAGDGGGGKSTLSLDLAANVTRGTPCFGLKYEAPGPAEVLLVSCEDDYADTVVPRLIVAGADLARVRRVDGVRGPDGKPQPFSLAHVEHIDAELSRRPGVRAIVIDPATSYVGRAGVDDHKDSQLRALLDPLAKLAAERRVLILLLAHFNKAMNAKAVYRVLAGVAYVNSVRASYAVVPDREDKGRRLFLPLKRNLGIDPPGLAYRMHPLTQEEQAAALSAAAFAHLSDQERVRMGKQLFRVEWEGEVDVDADEAMAALHRKDRDPNKVDRCVEWLRGFLKPFAYPSDEIVTAAEAKGFTFDNQKEAKVRLKAEGLRSIKKGFGAGAWWCGFGDPAGWTLRPAHSGEAPQPDAPHTHQNPQNPRNGDPSPIPGILGNVGSGEEGVEKDSPDWGDEGQGLDDRSREAFG
jgi:hypothetical protein